MVITDLPGVGESRDRDAEYEALYRDILPELDLVLWLIGKPMTAPCLWMSISGAFAPGTSAGAVCGDAGKNGALP